MSLNGSLNAVIALIENRPEVAKEIFRAPGSDVKNIGESTARLYSALDKYVANKLRTILVNTLTIQVEPETFDEIEKEFFFSGVRSVEVMIEDLVKRLES